ncbi:MAG TPA: DUF1501 domain-containing protein [Acidimicrobiia bacterium]|nr:DUF1501 domain-containing protein [Acidimicrobiia bacterium]
MSPKFPVDTPPFSRRRFLQFTAAGAGAVAVTPYLSHLKAFAAPSVADNAGILVTVCLAGGNDGLNTVIPSGNATYATLRPTLKITNGLSIGNGLALHPSLAKLKARYDHGKVAVVRGVGYTPPDLSHFTSTDIWSAGWGGIGMKTTGWLGRFIDTLPNANHESLYGVSLHGSVGSHLATAVGHPSSLPLNIGDAFGIDRSDPSDARMYDALVTMGSGSSELGALGDLYDTTEMELMQLTQRIRPAYNFSQQSTNIKQQLVLAAHLINANLGIRVIDCALDGFDTHSDQRDWHATLMSRLDDAIEAFFTTLSTRWKGQVALMTFSEFGRRPEENGDGGTDHGTAAPLFIVGDHVKGGQYGAQPSITDLDDNGNLKYHIDFRAVYASVLHTWLGANDASLLGHAYTRPSVFASGPHAPVTVKPVAPKGYWLASPGGHVHAFGAATKFGSLTNVPVALIGGAPTATHKGLWLVALDGHLYTFGDAKSHGSPYGKPLNKPILGMAATPTGKGYWLCASDGGMFCYGDAKYYGGTGNKILNKPIVGMATTPTGKGYWLCASDGGMFTFGDAKFHGSTGGKVLSAPIAGMAPTSTGKGYWLVGEDGKVYAFGDAKYHGGKVNSSAKVCAISRSPGGNGYWLAAQDGTVAAFGDAPVLGSAHDFTATLVHV